MNPNPSQGPVFKFFDSQDLFTKQMDLTKEKEEILTQHKLKDLTSNRNLVPGIALAIGVIVTLAALFFTLSAHQVLSMNFFNINQIGNWAYVVSYVGLAAGLTPLLVGSVKLYLNKRRNASIDKAQKEITDLQTTKAKDLFATKLKEGQLACVFIDNGRFLIFDHTGGNPLPLRNADFENGVMVGWPRYNRFFNGKTFVNDFSKQSENK